MERRQHNNTQTAKLKWKHSGQYIRFYLWFTDEQICKKLKNKE